MDKDILYNKAGIRFKLSKDSLIKDVCNHLMINEIFVRKKSDLHGCEFLSLEALQLLRLRIGVLGPASWTPSRMKKHEYECPEFFSNNVFIDYFAKMNIFY